MGASGVGFDSFISVAGYLTFCWRGMDPLGLLIHLFSSLLNLFGREKNGANDSRHIHNHGVLHCAGFTAMAWDGHKKRQLGFARERPACPLLLSSRCPNSSTYAYVPFALLARLGSWNDLFSLF